MNSSLRIYTTEKKELYDFLYSFYHQKHKIKKCFWEKEFENPVELADIIAAFIDNKKELPYSNMWVSIDSGVYINIKDDNYNSFIKYLFERYPY